MALPQSPNLIAWINDLTPFVWSAHGSLLCARSSDAAGRTAAPAAALTLATAATDLHRARSDLGPSHSPDHYDR
eukprot:2289902-Rhodomonas_salina.6